MTDAIKDYVKTLATKKEAMDLTWQDCTNMVNSQFGTDYEESTIRKYATYATMQDIIKKDSQLEQPNWIAYNENDVIERFNSDAILQMREYTRTNLRNESFKQLAIDCAERVAKSAPLMLFPVNNKESTQTGNKAALAISDWHFGLDIKNCANTFNAEICLERVNNLLKSVINDIELFNIDELYVFNLGDLVAGNIHTQIRLESRLDITEQVMTVTEILSQFLVVLATKVKVFYTQCLDNHSRVDPNRTTAFRPESFIKFTPWYLLARLHEFIEKGNITLLSNEFGDAFCNATIGDKIVVGVHGHDDKGKSIISDLRSTLGFSPDLILSAHLHSFSGGEDSNTDWVQNGALSGTDNHAIDIRKCAKPSQNLLILCDNSKDFYLHKIVL